MFVSEELIQSIQMIVLHNLDIRAQKVIIAPKALLYKLHAQ